MSQHIGKITGSSDIRIEQLASSRVQQSVTGVESSQRIRLTQASGLRELDGVLSLMVEMDEAVHDLAPSERRDVAYEFRKSLQQQVGKIVVDATDVDKAKRVLHPKIGKYRNLVKAVTDLGTATSIVTGGIALSEISDPSVGAAVTMVLVIAGLLSIDEARDIFCRVVSKLADKGLRSGSSD